MCLYEAGKDQAEGQERTNYKAVCRHKKLLILVPSLSQQQSEFERWYRYRGWDLGCWWCSLHHWGVVPTLLPVQPLPPHRCPHRCQCQCCFLLHTTRLLLPSLQCGNVTLPNPRSVYANLWLLSSWISSRRAFKPQSPRIGHNFLLYSCWGILLLWDHGKDAYQAEWKRMQAGSIRSKNYSISASKLLSHDNF